MSIVGRSLKDISSKFSSSILIGGVLRKDDVSIPKGDFAIHKNDTIYIVGQPSKVFQFCKRIGIHVQKVKSAMIMGGGRVAYYLAKYLDEMEIKVKIIEMRRERCVELTELLPNMLIIHGDGSDESVLQSENISGMGAFISVTGRDEDNLMSALLAKQYGVHKVVAKINRMNYASAIKNMGIDNVVCPKLITANYILRYVRGLQNAAGSPVNTLYRIMGERVEAIEFTAGASTKFLDVPLKKLKVAEGALVAAIVRKNEIIIPHGNDAIKEGDSVILIAKDKKLADLNDIAELEE
jgi:trk system potassium uptake protein TrkA